MVNELTMRKKDVADSASILLDHPYYIRHPTRQPAGTRVCRPQEQFTTPSPALKEKSDNARPDFSFARIALIAPGSILSRYACPIS